MTPNLQNFIRANRNHPVTVGAAVRNGGRGAHYTLANGRTYTLSREECAALPDHLPWWKAL